jgi:hypothetical protein
MTFHASVVATPLLHAAKSSTRFASSAGYHSATCEGVSDARRSQRVTPYATRYSTLPPMSSWS